MVFDLVMVVVEYNWYNEREPEDVEKIKSSVKAFFKKFTTIEKG